MFADISIIVPCYPPHIKYLNTTLNDISKQTVLPKEVILVISETNEKTKLELYEQFQILFDTVVDFKIINTEEKQYAGINRNTGVSFASCEYVMFIDADDTIHPQKVEITKYFLDKYKPNLLLHSYIQGKPVNFFESYRPKYQNAVVIHNDVMLHNTFGNPPKRNRVAEINRYSKKNKRVPIMVKIGGKYKTAHGYPCVKRSLFGKYKYTDMQRGQDSVFVRDILWHEGNVLYIDIPLLNYKPIID